MSSKIVTKARAVSYMGRFGERRIQVNETEINRRWGFYLPYFKIWIGIMWFGERKTKGISEDDF